MFKLTSSFSSWPSEAYQVCMIKFIALRLFLLNCKVIPKVWVRVYTKKWRLNFEIDFQNSIDLFVWPVNKLRKKNQAFPNSKEKKMKWILACDIKKKRKYNQKPCAFTVSSLYGLFGRDVIVLNNLIRHITVKHHVCKVRGNPSWSYLEFSLPCFPWICSNSIKLRPFLFVSFFEPFFSVFLLQPY